MRNHSYENDFDLHENKTACRSHFHTLTPFETEAEENSEMAYRLFCLIAVRASSPV